MLRSVSVKQLEKAFPPKQPTRVSESSQSPPSSSTTRKGNEAVTSAETEVSNLDDCDSGAVVMLFPPPSQNGWSLYRIFLACKLWILDLVDGAPDRGSDEDVSNQTWIHPCICARI